MNAEDVLEQYMKWATKAYVDEKKDVHTFIKEHNHICYTEAIIYPDGTIAYARPSHQETLIRATGKTRKELMQIIPIEDDVIEWLVNYTGCVCVWYNSIIKPNETTKEQDYTIGELIRSKLIIA